ncbi:MAG: hypothetical protein AB8H47_31395 [Bacteroidia bacterium]
MRTFYVLCLVILLGIADVPAQVVIAPPPPPQRVVIIRPQAPRAPHREVIVYREQSRDRVSAQRTRERERYHQELERVRLEREREQLERERESRERERERQCDNDRRSNSYDRFSLQLGAAANYSQGLWGTPYEGYNEALQDWQLNGFLGYRYDAEGRKRGNLFGVWYAQGLHDNAAMNQLLKNQLIPATASQNSVNEFREWEVGFILREWLRISGGKGYQAFQNSAGETVGLDYYTGTAGVALRLSKRIDITANGTVLLGEDFQNISFRPSAGVNFTFDFFNH